MTFPAGAFVVSVMYYRFCSVQISTIIPIPQNQLRAQLSTPLPFQLFPMAHVKSGWPLIMSRFSLTWATTVLYSPLCVVNFPTSTPATWEKFGRDLSPCSLHVDSCGVSTDSGRMVEVMKDYSKRHCHHYFSRFEGVRFTLFSDDLSLHASKYHLWSPSP